MFILFFLFWQKQTTKETSQQYHAQRCNPMAEFSYHQHILSSLIATMGASWRDDKSDTNDNNNNNNNITRCSFVTKHLEPQHQPKSSPYTYVLLQVPTTMHPYHHYAADIHKIDFLLNIHNSSFFFLFPLIFPYFVLQGHRVSPCPNQPT